MAPEEREPAEAEKLNTNEPGNVAGKPVTDGTDLVAGDDRRQVSVEDRDAVWADATVLEHDPDLAPPE